MPHTKGKYISEQGFSVKSPTTGVETQVIDADGTLNSTSTIDNGAVTAAKLATDAVETAKIKDLNVTTGKLAADAVTNAKLADSAVSIENLDAGITPSHLVKFAGKVTWTGDGATKAETVAGVVAGDIVIATIQTKPTQAAYLVGAVPSTDTITFELSAANTSNDAVISYIVLNAAA